MPEPLPPTDRAVGDDGAARVGAVVTVVGAVVFLALAAWLVPWHPYPGGSLTPVPADSLFTAAQMAHAEHYAAWARVWGWSGLALSLLAAAWLGFGRTGRRLVARLPGPWWLRALETVVLVSAARLVVTLPSAIAGQEWRRDNGLSTESWGTFATDALLQLAITAVSTGVGVLVLLACARRFRRWWPAVVGGLAVVLVLAGSFVYPVVVEPLFNHFTPLPDGPLRTQILALAAKEHVHIDDVLVSDASRRTTSLNAYVSGFGDTRRVVLYDTTVRDLPDDEIDAVVAHELAHAHHDDVLTGTLIGAGGALAGVGLLTLALTRLRRRGRPAASDPAVVPLVLALVALGSFLALPVQNGISRQIETRADVDGLRTTQDGRAFVGLQQQLALKALADPTPPAWSQWWFGSHPTVLQRAALVPRVLGVAAVPPAQKQIRPPD